MRPRAQNKHDVILQKQWHVSLVRQQDPHERGQLFYLYRVREQEA